VSKRIAGLARDLGVEVVEPDGRRVKLSPAGRALLERVSPLLVELRYALGGTQVEEGGQLSIGVAHSVLASWGPRALSRVKRLLPELSLAIHSHRSRVAVDRVRAGEYQLALAAGHVEATELAREPLGAEQMVLVPSGKHPRLSRGTQLDVLTIEPSSGTWREIDSSLGTLRRSRGVELLVSQTVETFACAIQMSRAGFGHALVPAGIARTYGVKQEDRITLPKPGLARSISLVGRRSVLSRPLATRLVAVLRDSVTRELRHL